MYDDRQKYIPAQLMLLIDVYESNVLIMVALFDA